jgi:hypothetical protein
LLLDALGLPREVFVELMWDHISLMNRITWDVDVAVSLLSVYHRSKIDHKSNFAHMVAAILQDPDNMKSHDIRIALTEIRRKETRWEKQNKIRPLCVDSRLLYGVYDQSGCLEHGQCFLRLMIRGTPRFCIYSLICA